MGKTKTKGIGKGVKIAIIALVAVLIIGGIGVYQFFFASAKTTTTPTPISNNGPTVASVWQNLYITNIDGTSYWAQAQQPFNLFANLESLLGSQSGSGADFNTVSTIQNNIYMNVAESGVTGYTFSCTETIQLWDTQGDIIETICNASPITETSTQALTEGQSYWVTGATVSASSLQNILGEPTGEYYYVITLANIQMTLTVNGQSQPLTAPTPTTANMLQWLIKIA